MENENSYSLIWALQDKLRGTSSRWRCVWSHTGSY